jgi:hypothetical protein
METYSKLSSALVHSTVWREPDHVRLVWITMLALKDKEGAIRASVPGLADAARVSLEKTVEALARLAAPDEWSRSKAEDGRRIREIPGGWQLINAELYRLLGTSDERRAQVRKAVQKHRNHVITGNQGKPKKSPKSPIVYADQDQDQKQRREEKRGVSPSAETPPSPKLGGEPGSDAKRNLADLGPDAGAVAAPGAKKGSNKSRSPEDLALGREAHVVIGWFCEAFKKARGFAYVVAPKEAGMVKGQLGGAWSKSLVPLLPIMFERYLADQDKYIVSKGWSLAHFLSDNGVNKYRMAALSPTQLPPPASPVSKLPPVPKRVEDMTRGEYQLWAAKNLPPRAFEG